MKKFYFLLVTCFMFLAGCNNENPVMSDPDVVQKEWITLPEAVGLSLENSIFASARINGSQGGELLLQGSYQSNTARPVIINSKLTVPAGAYSGLRLLTEEVGTGAYSDFGPSMVFNQSLLLDFSISGIDLSGIDPSAINFYYMSPSGVLEPTQHDGVFVDLITGTLKVTKARINHFSRYGWAK